MQLRALTLCLATAASALPLASVKSYAVNADVVRSIDGSLTSIVIAQRVEGDSPIGMAKRGSQADASMDIARRVDMSDPSIDIAKHGSDADAYIDIARRANQTKPSVDIV
ncbi:uncharacterized protein N7446_007845 [Penicillium canescens]|uniref:Uncharacterized protein n=1 Tax=Penicillium canescens TaxID=5083 RepID=A0AAD6NDS6_PENCN|nr:uncharacterized protein N7446_007845 [Penicillium canescens]KAJ6033860.1 hypothetical protein N7444_011631 [Penicillium canescens]KAJ6056952.1 hypothetical protein N7460_000226 [Penicillium canescens]KAJ6058262.1 hypothetical protein N7446_007845 [Penicillium canescens]